MPKRWHTRLILEDKQDTGQIFYGRKVQILGDTV
jgi:predicted lipid carrier protein YhbT